MALQADVEEVMDLTEQVYKAAEQQTYDKQLQPIVDKCAEEMKTWADKYKVALPAEKTADAFISFAQRYEEASRGWLYAEVTEEDLQPRQKLSEDTAAKIRELIGEEDLRTTEQTEQEAAQIEQEDEQAETPKGGVSLTAKLMELTDEGTEAAARAMSDMDVVSNAINSLGRLRLYYNNFTAILIKETDGRNWLLTGWENKKEANGYATGAGYDASSATAGKPTQTRLAGVDSFTSKENVPQYEDVVNKRGENREIKFSSDEVEDYTDEEWARDNEIGTVTDGDDGRGSRRGKPEAA